ncbi:hypothetical protein QYM36_017906 [Artemia franciscana]|uniref:Uncharacterized protein n=1 Tax=Artemia franciscana TaxID=6661 RepID=A0AA88H7T8_ARTSF|nr:hypothetical protein QYM36_017906 [Artemia franciscana]
MTASGNNVNIVDDPASQPRAGMPQRVLFPHRNNGSRTSNCQAVRQPDIVYVPQSIPQRPRDPRINPPRRSLSSDNLFLSVSRNVASAECQTEVQPQQARRRRDRRERRNRRPHSMPAPQDVASSEVANLISENQNPGEAVIPPAYSTLPHTSERVVEVGGGLPPVVPTGDLVPPLPIVGQPTVSAVESGFMGFPYSCRRNRGSIFVPDESPKTCCGVPVTQTVSIRWFVVMIAFVGICCAVVGTVLGAMKATGREHLTVSLLMIGIVLITVSGIAWRLTSHDAPSCRAMLGLGSRSEPGIVASADPTAPEATRSRFLARMPPSHGRPHHPYAAMLYPEFQYRPPPPSYQASMQEYRLRLLLLDRERPSQNHNPASSLSPPPTYRSNASTLLRVPLTLARETDASRPPSYRSRSSASTQPGPSMRPQGINQVPPMHSQEPSQISYISDSSQTTTVINTEVPITHQRTQSEPAARPKEKSRFSLPKRNKAKKDNNIVTIVQTQNGSSVIVEPELSSPSNIQDMQSSSRTEVEILAHL